MEVVGSEVDLWLSDEWIGVSFIEEIDIDTTMFRDDLSELRVIGAWDMLIDISDDTREYPCSAEIPTREDDESSVFREILDKCLELGSDPRKSMKPSHVIARYLEEDSIVLSLFDMCYLSSDIGDDSSWDSPILDSCRTDQLREPASNTLLWGISTDSYSDTISEDEKWYSTRISGESIRCGSHYDRLGYLHEPVESIYIKSNDEYRYRESDEKDFGSDMHECLLWSPTILPRTNTLHWRSSDITFCSYAKDYLHFSSYFNFSKNIVSIKNTLEKTSWVFYFRIFLISVW